MIAVDTSALAAVVLNEATAPACRAALMVGRVRIISAVSLAEALIVARGRGKHVEMGALLEGLGLATVPVTVEAAHRVAAIYARWGKGEHPARLNFADCFAYDVATTHGCPLLYVGGDFAQTDVASVLADPA